MCLSRSVVSAACLSVRLSSGVIIGNCLRLVHVGLTVGEDRIGENEDASLLCQ